jgi:pre-mRNA-splicing factor ATP-dependent RNA helicase DHX16
MDLKMWVNDRLHDVLGMSDRTIADYLIGLGKSSSNVEKFIGQLKQSGALTVDRKMEAFCEELWDRLPRKAPIAKAAVSDSNLISIRAAEVALLKKNQSYRPVVSSDDEEPVPKIEPKVKIKAERDEERKRHVRKRDWTKEEEDDEKSPSADASRAATLKRAKSASVSEDEFDKEERLRLEDLKERDQFASRMKVYPVD